MIRLITFDLDNTLWEVTPVIIEAERTMRRWLVEQVPDYESQATAEIMGAERERALQQDPSLRYNISRLRVQLLGQALKRCGLANEQAQDLAGQAFEIFMQGRNNVEFYPDALSVLKHLAKSYRLAGLTNGNADFRTMPLVDLFEFSLSPEQVQARKPEPAIFDAVIERTGVLPHEIVHVGDHLQEDVSGAAAAGWHAVWVNLNGADAPTTVEHHASIESLSELPSAIAALDKR